MSLLYLGILLFLFILAICDLSVGVANDAVNFMSPAVGARAAKFKVVLIVATIGILVGASASSGMMDIARHGIINPFYYTFDDVICIFLAVSATDIILMDIFNTLGMPTSTTVSMVFGLLGGSSALALSKMMDNAYTYADLINTGKALQVIIGIFLSVAIAFVVGLIVMWIARVIFTFNYKKHLRWSIAIYGGLAITCISYFLLVSGLKGTKLLASVGMTPEWVNTHNWEILIYLFVGATILMEILHLLKVNIFRIIVLFGTFSLAMAFAGNDLVNFIGVPLSGLESYIDFTRHGSDGHTYIMSILAAPSTDPLFVSMKPWFLIGAGIVMVLAISMSQKARKVIETNNNLASQQEGEEVFSSSKIARTMVRTVINATSTVDKIIPKKVETWINTRFNEDESIIPEGATFDLVRASVNLVLSGLLIVVGTSLQLPLSTTYVAFMVGMGSSLADRAWGRETAVYRITGVITVIGGWFITAGAAFILSLCIASINHSAGVLGILIVIGIVIVVIIRNNRAFKKKQSSEDVDLIFRRLAKSHNKQEVWELLSSHVLRMQGDFTESIREIFRNITNGVMHENIRQLRQASHDLDNLKNKWKRYRRKEILGMRKIDYLLAVEKNTWFHLGSNNMTQIIYSLKRMLDPALEHVDNNFSPLSKEVIDEFIPICNDTDLLLESILQMVKSNDFKGSDKTLVEGNALKSRLSQIRHTQQDHLQREENNIRAALLYLNMLDETQELISMMRHLLRAAKRFQQ